MKGYPLGIMLVDLTGTGYRARVAERFNDLELTNGSKVGELDPWTPLGVHSRRYGRVLVLVPDLSDSFTAQVMQASKEDT